jgi:hypothetical protein
MTNDPRTREQELQLLLDKNAIREATMRYCRGVDRLNADLISSAYHPDAYDDHSGRTFTGDTVGQGLVDWLTAGTDATNHHITTQTIQVNGDTAGCESYYIGVHLLTRDGVQRTVHSAGRYIDRFEKRDGQWKIATRLVALEKATYLPPDTEPQSAGVSRRDRQDPSYTVMHDHSSGS